ncbi:hypothetical protein [Microcoleus sp. CAWBG58]|uniref:hypothetical protein n=1 Tax=Microcoleus sp. CAWBG58 TaxID=2841651 RepID=UPI0025F5BC1C|nr:hypothetical protein [Microcoleus sp. CAWBG58]
MGAIYNLNPASVPTPPQPLARNAGTPVSTAITTTSSVALAANANRANYSFYNAGPATILLREGTTVAANSYERPLPPGFHFHSEPSSYRYTGPVSMIATSGTATVMVTESTLI